MSIVQSTLYGQGQKVSESTYQGSTYLEATYTERISFDANFDITTATNSSLYRPTVSNYPEGDKPFFMGSFDGFWVHKIYNNGHLVLTVQGVDQDMFIPVQHDRVESVTMNMVPNETIPCPDCPVRPPVPAPGVSAVLGVAALFAMGRKRFNKY
jgi:hypothetical protein